MPTTTDLEPAWDDFTSAEQLIMKVEVAHAMYLFWVKLIRIQGVSEGSLSFLEEAHQEVLRACKNLPAK